MDNQKYYAIYSRKSKYTSKGESIDNQIELCKKYLLSKYENITEKNIKVYQDEGFTGYNTKRPEFQQMLDDIKNYKIKTIIVYRLDRISRNVSDFCKLKDKLAKYNVDFMSVTENFDTSTPMGTAMLMISSVFAQLERDTIAERIKDNMYELAKTGRWLGGNTPLGYKSKKIEITEKGKTRSQYQLETNEYETKIVKIIWNKMNELKGINKLEKYLINNNIKTRNNNYFTRFSLTRILKNPVYCIANDEIIEFFKNKGASVYINKNDIKENYGLIAYNKTSKKMGKNLDKDISNWIIAIGKHKGIIPSKTFINIWNTIENNKNKRLRKPSQNSSILSGLIRCKYCNSYMRPRTRSTYTIDKKRNFSYMCTLKDKSRKKLCTCKNINGIETDELVIKSIKKLKVPVNMIIMNLKKIKKKKETIINRNKSNKQIMKEEQIINLAKKIIKEYIDILDNLDIINKRLLLKRIINKIETNGNNIYIDLKPQGYGSRSNP